ncbi:uncharacterized protein LOC111326977 [Stylophora pistillata]|uniref:UPAR/Ly6 domain-containing protein n=1 Tax=Stylophora pistillata TaxID=50429 RepID=A0A2B4SHF9_STYPI|nr:uncharacterized protein LOC111326977 [Stylophora pistillata]PFX27912.1 hypothetical protein AWC38_SpisGene7363 [Stylophora pistillata]
MERPLIYTLFFISLLGTGLSLMCHTCYSQKSGADCTRNVTPRNCSGILDVCMSVRRTATLTNGNTVHEFAKSCFMDGLCTHFFCEQKHDHEKKVVCHLDCCTTSLCNTRPLPTIKGSTRRTIKSKARNPLQPESN